MNTNQFVKIPPDQKIDYDTMPQDTTDELVIKAWNCVDDFIAKEQKELNELTYKFLKRDIVRFLIARECDYKKVIELLEGFSVWFEEYKPHEILASQCITGIQTKSAYLHKYDKLHRSCIFVRARFYNANIRVLEDIERFSHWIVGEALRKLPYDQSQFVAVFDFLNVTWENVDYQLIKKIIYALDHYYCEFLGALYFINTGWIFWLAWKIVSPWIPPRTKAKIHWFEKNKTSDLLNHFNIDDLPLEFGGTDQYQFTPEQVFQEYQIEISQDSDQKL